MIGLGREPSNHGAREPGPSQNIDGRLGCDLLLVTRSGKDLPVIGPSGPVRIDMLPNSVSVRREWSLGTRGRVCELRSRQPCSIHTPRSPHTSYEARIDRSCRNWYNFLGYQPRLREPPAPFAEIAAVLSPTPPNPSKEPEIGAD